MLSDGKCTSSRLLPCRFQAVTPRYFLLVMYNCLQDVTIAKSEAEELAERGTLFSDDRFLHGFLASISVIIVSELGDKTFFIAAIM